MQSHRRVHFRPPYKRSSTTIPRPKARTVTKTKTKTKTGSKTMTTKKRLFEKVKVDGPVSSSFHRFPARCKFTPIPKFVKAVTSPQYWVSNSTGRLTAGVGIQAFFATGGPGLYTPSDLTNIFTQASIITGGGITTPNPKTQRIMLKSCTSELMITNQTNDVVNLKIYDVVARRDISASGYWNPGAAWNTGCTDQGVSSQSTIVGSNPFQTPGFTSFWQVEKVFNVPLHSGGHHVHRSQAKVNHLFNDEELQQVGASNAALKGLTRYSFVVIHGYPANDQVTTTQVSTSACSVDMIWSKQYQYVVFEKSSTFANNSNILPVAFTVGESQINDLTGAIATTLMA